MQQQFQTTPKNRPLLLLLSRPATQRTLEKSWTKSIDPTASFSHRPYPPYEESSRCLNLVGCLKSSDSSLVSVEEIVQFLTKVLRLPYLRKEFKLWIHSNAPLDFPPPFWTLEIPYKYSFFPFIVRLVIFHWEKG